MNAIQSVADSFHKKNFVADFRMAILRLWAPLLGA